MKDSLGTLRAGNKRAGDEGRQGDGGADQEDALDAEGLGRDSQDRRRDGVGDARDEGAHAVGLLEAVVPAGGVGDRTRNE